MKLLIIGADAAGMSAASRAKRNNPDIDVTVLEKTQDVSYSACGMPYNIADAGKSAEELVVRTAEKFREKQGITILTGHEATGINRRAKSVSVLKEDGTETIFSYDKLLIATGARALKSGIPGEDHKDVMHLKTLMDTRKIKERLTEKPVTRAVIIGMGYIGLELCEAFVKRGIEVVMLKKRDTFLPWMHPDLAGHVREELESAGVTVITGCRFQKIEDADERRLTLCTSLGDYECDLIIVATGIEPRSELAVKAGLATGTGGAICVDRNMRTSDPDIYAAGDCADTFHVVTGEKTWIPLGLLANRSGRVAGDNVCGIPSRIEGVAGTTVFKVLEMQVARTGLTLEEASGKGFHPVGIVVKTWSRAHVVEGSKPVFVHMIGDKKSGKLLGVFMVGRDGVAHRINAPAVALSAGMTVYDLAQTDLGYAPPFGPVWDPVLTAANQLLKKL